MRRWRVPLFQDKFRNSVMRFPKVIDTLNRFSDERRRVVVVMSGWPVTAGTMIDPAVLILPTRR